jgi:MFS family permease
MLDATSAREVEEGREVEDAERRAERRGSWEPREGAEDDSDALLSRRSREEEEGGEGQGGAGGEEAGAAREGGATVPPLPLAKMVVLGAVVFSNTFASLLITPFVAFAVMRFTGRSRSDVGYETGLLEASFHVGNFFGSLIAGSLADLLGRRPVLVYGLAGTTLATILFGVASDFGMAMTSRFLWGLLNGNTGVAKTALGDILHVTQQARGFSMIGIISGAARLLAPAVGGLLADPVGSYGPNAFWGDENGFLGRYPWALPCFFTAAICVLNLVGALYFLPESLPEHKRAANLARFQRTWASTFTLCRRLRRRRPATAPDAPSSARKETAGDVDGRDTAAAAAAAATTTNGSALPSPDEENSAEEEREGLVGASTADAAATPLPASTDEDERQTLRALVRDPRVFYSVSFYAAVAFVAMGGNELLPLQLVLPVSHGGLHWTAANIGLASSSVGVVLLVFQLFAYPPMVHRFGLLETTRYATGLLVVVFLATPFLEVLSRAPLVEQWAGVVAVMCSMMVGRVVTFTNIMVLVANSTDQSTRGAVNGISQAFAAVARASAPVTFAPLFAWSASRNGAWPLNHHFAWIALAAATVGTVWLAVKMPPSLAKPREDSDDAAPPPAAATPAAASGSAIELAPTTSSAPSR